MRRAPGDSGYDGTPGNRELARMKLNSNHRRALAAAVREIERSLARFERSLSAAPAAHRRATSAALEKINDLRALLAAFREEAEIPAESPPDPWWEIRVGVARLWEMLEDCRPGPMDSYGPVPAESRSQLDSRLDELIQELEELSRIAAGARK